MHAFLLLDKTFMKTLVKGYAEKQWGKKCDELPSFIIKRLPVKFTFDNNYLNDLFQGIPIAVLKIFFISLIQIS